MATCRVCKQPIWSAARAAITEPDELAGEAACDYCKPRLSALAMGQLPRGQFSHLVDFARKDEALLAILYRHWDRTHAGEKAAQADAEALADARRAALDSMLVTSGFGFEGHSILGYLGFRSAEVVLGMGAFRAMGADFADFFGAESQGLNQRLLDAKAAAFSRLKTEVANAGGNAIIGIDLDYTMFGTSLVGVIASGTAVVVEPSDR